MTDDELNRYSRHILLPEFDCDGQEKLLRSSVLIVGLGGLGSAAAMYLAASGVGTLVLNDYDEVDLGNLQRQIAHRTADIGRPKTDSAQDALNALNPQVKLETIAEKLSGSQLQSNVERVDVVVDASDNFATRHALNEACVAARRPLVSGAAIRFEGQLTVFDPRNPLSPCYRCLFGDEPEIQESCSRTGVFSPLVGMMGSAQAGETIKLLTEIGKPLIGKLWRIDAKSLAQRTSTLLRDPDCPVCSRRAPGARTA